MGKKSKPPVVKRKAKNPEKRDRILVPILSFILFINACYLIKATFYSNGSNENIKWRFVTLLRLLISVSGYSAALLKHKHILTITLVLILIDLMLSFGICFSSFDEMWSKYDEHLNYLGNMQNRTVEFNAKDCDFIKIFRSRIVETLILVSFYILYLALILELIDCIEKSETNDLNDSQTDMVAVDKRHLKWGIVLLSSTHAIYLIYLFYSKIFKHDDEEGVLAKKDYLYVFFWSLIALLSTIIAGLAPFAVFKLKSNIFIVNFYVSTVMSSTLLAFSKFLIIIYKEIFSSNPENDYYCNIRLTSIDNLISIFALMVINKIIIALLLSLTYELRKF